VEVQVHRLWLISCRVCPRTEFLPKEKTRKQPRLTVKERGQRERKGARGKTPINARAALPALAPAGLVRAHARSLAFALIGFLRTANLPGLPAGAPAGCSLPGLLRGRVALVCKDSSMEPSAFLPAHSVIQVGARYPATHPPPEPCSWRVAYPTPHRSPCRRKFGGRHPGNTKENAAAGRGNPGAHSPGVCGMCPQPPLAGSAAHLPAQALAALALLLSASRGRPWGHVCHVGHLRQASARPSVLARVWRSSTAHKPTCGDLLSRPQTISAPWGPSRA